MIGQEFSAPCTLQHFVKTNETCVKFLDFIDKSYAKLSIKKKNITVGFGFVSHNHGLSMGVPVDIYTMLLVTEKIRRTVLAPNAEVHVLIGDHFAFACPHQSCEDSAAVSKKREKYSKKIGHILQNLGIEKHYHFHYSSQIIADSNYQKCRANLEIQAEKIVQFEPVDIDKKLMINLKSRHIISKDTWEILNPTPYSHYDASNRNYFLDQTALFQFLFTQYDCGLKVSWSKSTQNSKVAHSKSFDEPHFDRFFREINFDQADNISFVYTLCGYAINRKDERSKVIPYTATDDPEIGRLLLTSKQPIPTEINKMNPELVKSVAHNCKLLQSLHLEVDYQKITVSNIEDFHRNVNFLKMFSRSPAKNIAITLQEKLQLFPKAPVNKPDND